MFFETQPLYFYINILKLYILIHYTPIKITQEKYFYHLFSHLHKKAQRILLCLYISKVWMISLRDCVLCLRIFYNFYFFFCQAIKFIYHLVYCCVCLFYFRFYRNGFLLFLQEIIFPFCLF